MARRTRYRFSHRLGGRYYWYSTTRVGIFDSRYEVISCPVSWFWGKSVTTAGAQDHGR